MCLLGANTHTNSIYSLEKQIHQRSGTSGDAEASPLLESSTDDPDKVFTSALEKELEKICSFYQLKELEVYGELDDFFKDEENYEEGQDLLDTDPANARPGSRGSKGRQRVNSLFRAFSVSFKDSNRRRRGSTFSSTGRDPDDDDEDSDDEPINERSALRKPSIRGPANGDSHYEDLRNSSELLSRRRASQRSDDLRNSSEMLSSSRHGDFTSDPTLAHLFDTGITLKKRAISLYVSLCELKSFIQLNRTGFAKVLKKYDKILDRNLKPVYLTHHVAPAQPFVPDSSAALNASVERVERAYARVVTKGDGAAARQELRLHLREHVVWDRNTVWREMIGIERKAQAANMGVRQTMLEGRGGVDGERLQGDEAPLKKREIRTPVGRYWCPSWLLDTAFYTLLGSLIVFFVLLYVPIMERPEQQNCLAMVVFVSLLWATEVRLLPIASNAEHHVPYHANISCAI